MRRKRGTAMYGADSTPTNKFVADLCSIMQDQTQQEEQADHFDQQAMGEFLKRPATPISTAFIDINASHQMIDSNKSENPPDELPEPLMMALIHEQAHQTLAALVANTCDNRQSGIDVPIGNDVLNRQGGLSIHGDDGCANAGKATRRSKRKISANSENSKKPNPKQRRPTVIAIHEAHTHKRDDSEDEGDLSWTTKDDKLDITGTTALDAKAMTPTERQIVLLKRKLRNRESARRSRIKKQSTMVELNEEYSRLKDQFASLHQAAQAGMEETEKLRCLNEELRRRIRELDTSGDVEFGSELGREPLPTLRPD